jgi:threonine aldolase
MEITISMNTLIQAIFSVELNIKRHRMLLDELGETITDDQAEQYGESLMSLMQTSGELGTVYDEERQKMPQENLPSYEAVCARFVFI